MRPSRRAPDELRPVTLERGVVKYAEGSCMVKFGDTHVLVTATLWSLPTTAGYRQFRSAADGFADPMAETVIAVDTAHRARDAGRAVSGWQRDQLRRWRSGDVTASPLWWAALATFAVVAFATAGGITWISRGSKGVGMM